jgi:hypothetical protein
MCRLALICAGYSRRKWGEAASRVAGERITVLRHARLRAASIPPPAKRWGHRARCLFPSPAKRWGGWHIVSVAKRCVGLGVVQRIPNAGREFCSSRPPPDWPSASHPPHKKWGRDKKHRCAALPQQRVIIARSARDEAIHVSFAARWIFAGARNDSPEQTAASPFIPPTASRREGKEAASSPPGVPAVSLSYFCRGHLENGAGLQHVTRRADAIRRFGVLAPRTAKPAQDPLRNCSMPRAPSCSRA